MELIENNPYRIAGILSNTTAKEVEKQRGKIRAFAKVGKEIKSNYDFQILESISRTIDSIDKAFSNVEQNQDKVNFALFWFLNANPFDKTAIEYLKNGDSEKAIEIWEKVTFNKEVNSKNFSAFSNLGTYKLLSQSQDVIKKGIEAKIKLIESEYFESFVHSVADETFTIDNKKQIEKLVDELLTQFKNQYSSAETLQLFSNCSSSIQKYLSKKFTEEPIHNIENQIESTKKKRKKNKNEAYKFGLNLVTNCKDDLVLLQSLLGKTDLKYKTVADQLANEIMQCGIDYFNESQENDSSERYLEQALKLTKAAGTIAIGKLTKDRAKDSLATLLEMKDKEMSEAIDVLQSIKDAYENNASNLMRQVKAQEYSMDYGQSINWSKVNELIKNSIDWDKAIVLIQNAIPKSNILIIQNIQNSNKINKYKELVEFIFGKLNFLNKNKIGYLQYWETARTKQVNQAKTLAKDVGKTAMNTAGKINDASGGCLGEIFSRVIGIIILIIIIGILSAIFD
jgi:tetratricopeptide (TPR) repeat protein